MDNFDKIIQEQPIIVPIRKHLSQDTMEAVKQIKRVRLARKMLGIVLIVATLLLLAKWMSNDLLYLVQVVFYKFALVKAHTSLYWSALEESLPRPNLLTIIVLSILWFGWRYFETFLVHTRITSRKKGILITTIKMTPRLVIANALIVATALGISAYSYAQKTEQPKLQILREHVNQGGRKEFNTNLTPTQCMNGTKDNPTNQFEIKKGTNLTTEDAGKVLEAACNQREAEKFFVKALNLGDPNYGANYFDSTKNKEGLTTVVQVISHINNILTVDMRNIMSTPTKEFPKTFELTSTTKVYKNEEPVSQNVLKKGDVIIILYSYYYENSQSSPTKTTVDGIVILPSDPDFHWYGNTLQNSVTQVQTCQGNPQDRCSFTGGIDIFPSGGNEALYINPLFNPQPGGQTKDISGELIKITDQSVQIKTSSGRIFTFNFGSNPIEEFNKNRSQYYNNTKIGLGDTLWVTYNESPDHHGTTFNTESISHAELMLEIINKHDPIQKY